MLLRDFFPFSGINHNIKQISVSLLLTIPHSNISRFHKISHFFGFFFSNLFLDQSRVSEPVVKWRESNLDPKNKDNLGKIFLNNLNLANFISINFHFIFKNSWFWAMFYFGQMLFWTIFIFISTLTDVL